MTPGAADPGLLRRVGALPTTAPATASALHAAHPRASDAAIILAQLSGVAPAAQPKPTPSDALRYVATTAEDALLAGLTARAARYAQLGVRGPGVDIQLQGTEA